MDIPSKYFHDLSCISSYHRFVSYTKKGCKFTPHVEINNIFSHFLGFVVIIKLYNSDDTAGTQSSSYPEKPV